MSKKGKLIARELSSGDLDAWAELSLSHGTIFDSLRWTEMFLPALRRIGIYDRGDNLRGGFSLYEERRFGMRLIRNPPFTPQIGPFFERRAKNSAAKTNEQRAIMEAMAEYLTGLAAPVVSIGLSHGIEDCLPFLWRDYKVVPHYTYRIDLSVTEDDLLGALSPDRRKSVKKAKKENIAVTEVSTDDVIHSLVLESLKRSAAKTPDNVIQQIFSNFKPGQDAYCFLTTLGDDPLAGVYVVHDANTAYYLMGGYVEGAHHGAGATAMYQAILKAKYLGLKVFDFEGSVIPPIEKYFRGFGGQLTPVFSVHKAWLPLEVALKFMKRTKF